MIRSMRPRRLFAVLFLAVLAWGLPAVSRSGPLADALVAVDVGHGHKRPGATSARGVPEYRFNLDMARLVVEELHRAGLPKAFLLDPTGADIPPAGRARRANRDKAAVLVSIHHDSVQPQYLEDWIVEGRRGRYCDRFAGYSLFFSAKNPKAGPSLDLAKAIGERLRDAGFTPTAHHAEPIRGENREMVDPQRGVYRYDGLAVLGRAAMPAVLVECGVIVNRDEETALTDPDRRVRQARAIAQGVAVFLERAMKKTARSTASPRTLSFEPTKM
ncbi:N-acetylmuramoyl-L-alanine amidase family protein [Desulfolutivibrio sulfoxidireducens]|uniref:N-acetylmuramoyl-L-alanine amidase family protein n=1 Tax=Desulfolutivibrio sulfoxidireducens TaxID=2773299 RepID=UPI00210B6864|nr:N-acetylmuramoyl-L-alanine amidase [Desulfolutivibrio sulfoxidireducens]